MKKLIAKALFGIGGISSLFWGCCLDSAGYLPCIALAISLAVCWFGIKWWDVLEYREEHSLRRRNENGIR